MDKSEIQTPQENKPLFDEEEREKLIKEHLTEEEIDNLTKAGFSRDQIAWVGKEKASSEKFGKNFNIVAEILPWLPPY